MNTTKGKKTFKTYGLNIKKKKLKLMKQMEQQVLFVLALSGRCLKWFRGKQNGRFWDTVGIHRLAPAGTAEFEGTLQTQGCWGP